MPRPTFDIQIRGRGDRRALILRGEMDLDTASQLDDALQTVCADGAREVVLDLRGLSFVDTTGLRTLLGGRDFCGQHDCRYLLDAALPKPVDRMFALTGAWQHFDFKRRKGDDG
jgi:anti-sigma B factor antagonist